MMRLRSIAALVCALSVLPVFAQTAPAQPRPAPPPGGRIAIPQAAFDACAGKTAGAAVSWKGMHGNLLKGVCRQYSAGTLVAVPDRMAGGMRPATPMTTPGGMGPGSMGGTMMVPPPQPK